MTSRVQIRLQLPFRAWTCFGAGRGRGEGILIFVAFLIGFQVRFLLLLLFVCLFCFVLFFGDLLLTGLLFVLFFCFLFCCFCGIRFLSDRMADTLENLWELQEVSSARTADTKETMSDS